MCQHQIPAERNIAQERVAGLARLFDVSVGNLCPLGMGALHRTMDQIAGDDRTLAARMNPQRRVTRRVAGCWGETQPVTEVAGWSPRGAACPSP